MSQTANHDVIVPHRKWPAHRLRLKKLPKAVRITITAVLALIAILLAVWAFNYYEDTPGRVMAASAPMS
jgi:hypothetical protein